MFFNHRIGGFLLKTWDYSPYKYSELLNKSFGYSKKQFLARDLTSKKIYDLMIATEKKSALDYYFWNNTLLYLTSNEQYSGNFERNFQNAVILSRNNSDINRALRLYYLRNITRFSKETKKIVMKK